MPHVGFLPNTWWASTAGDREGAWEPRYARGGRPGGAPRQQHLHAVEAEGSRRTWRRHGRAGRRREANELGRDGEVGEALGDAVAEEDGRRSRATGSAGAAAGRGGGSLPVGSRRRTGGGTGGGRARSDGAEKRRGGRRRAEAARGGAATAGEEEEEGRGRLAGGRAASGVGLQRAVAQPGRRRGAASSRRGAASGAGRRGDGGRGAGGGQRGRRRRGAGQGRQAKTGPGRMRGAGARGVEACLAWRLGRARTGESLSCVCAA